MNYYIDFDHTLYNTPKLTQKMLETIVVSMQKQKKFVYENLLKECKSMFNREHIYNIYELVEYFSNKYAVEPTSIVHDLNKTILNREDLVFDDSIPFLKKLKNNGHKIYLFSYQPFGLQFQITKIAGSHLVDFFDAQYITAMPKYQLDIDYSNGIFIDDNPTDLLGLYSKKPLDLIRIRRKNDTYSSVELELPKSEIKECENLSEIIVNNI